MKQAVLKDLKSGARFFLGKEIEYVILEHFSECGEDQSPEGYTFVEAVENECTGPFDRAGCNDWRKASLRTWLNRSYLDILVRACPTLKDAAVPFLRDLTADDGLKDYGTCMDTVSMLTAGEYRKYRDLHREPPESWRWTITPNSTPSGAGDPLSRVIYVDGTMHYNSVNDNAGSVRPTLYLKSGLTVYVEGDEENEDQTPEQKEMALYETAVEKFGEDAQLLIAIEEMSELSKALLKWLRYKNFDQGRREELLKNVDEERADVSIMLNQLEVIFGENGEAEAEKLDHLAGLVGLPPLGLTKEKEGGGSCVLS